MRLWHGPPQQVKSAPARRKPAWRPYTVRLDLPLGSTAPLTGTIHSPFRPGSYSIRNSSSIVVKIGLGRLSENDLVTGQSEDEVRPGQSVSNYWTADGQDLRWYFPDGQAVDADGFVEISFSPQETSPAGTSL